MESDYRMNRLRYSRLLEGICYVRGVLGNNTVVVVVPWYLEKAHDRLPKTRQVMEAGTPSPLTLVGFSLVPTSVRARASPQ